MSCANTSLPWFIEPPRAMLPGRAAKPKFEIQIETKKINRLCVFHQQLTGAENPNVGTLLKRNTRSSLPTPLIMEEKGALRQNVLSVKTAPERIRFRRPDSRRFS